MYSCQIHTVSRSIDWRLSITRSAKDYYPKNCMHDTAIAFASPDKAALSETSAIYLESNVAAPAMSTWHHLVNLVAGY